MYLWGDRWIRRWVRLLEILHEGFWLGFLDADDLTTITLQSFQQSRMYNGPEHNLSGLFPWEREAIDRFFRPGSRILVPACGGGRELLALHHLGFQADGFECTPSLVETSRRLLQQLEIPSTVALCPANEVPLALPMYDGILVGWGAYTHICGSTRRIAFLRKLRASLAPGNPLLVSFWIRQPSALDENRIFWLGKRIGFLLGRNTEPVELGDHVSDRGYYHRFVQEEIEAELHAAGFPVCHYSQADQPCAVGIAQ
jgi:hypothetical protein